MQQRPRKADVIRWLWLLFALTLPFFAGKWLRIELIGKIAIPAVLLVVIMYGGIIRAFVASPLRKEIRGGSLVLVLSLTFLTWHLVGALRAEEIGPAVKEIIKLTSCVSVMWVIALSFPSDRAFERRFWLVVFAGSSAVMLYLMYFYAVVWEYGALGNDLTHGKPVKFGRNLMGYYLAIVLPFCLSFCFLDGGKTRGQRLLGRLCLLVLLTAWLYVSSRATWVSGILATIAIVWATRRWGHLLLFVGLSTLAYFAIVGKVGELELVTKVVYLFDPSSAPHLNTYENRLNLLEQAFSLWRDAPILGIGLTDIKTSGGLWPHNDYLAILTDLGVIGLGLFVSILLVAFVIVVRPVANSTTALPWASVGARGALVAASCFMMFTDAYTFLLLWIVLGFCLASARREVQVS